MSSRRGQTGGFTLLELLAATAMTAVLAGSLYATLHVAFKARRTATAAIEQVRKGELSVELIRADIESAVVPEGILAGAFLGESGTDAAGRPMDSLLLHCTADGAGGEEGAGDIRMVQLGCEPAEGGEGMVLLRRLTLNLLTPKVQEPAEEVLCRGVRSFDLTYFDGFDWQESWDSGAQDNALPLAVQITLELMPEGGASGDEAGYFLSRVIRIPCSSIVAGLEAEADR